ncbi:MAG: nucleotidyltransferase domain-containing protein [Oscillospiraceae bacterium]|jgi:predicted nucleotidyltransferase|nr:nucleotidyltransferase domain-containing protein [Oscillospiraceae bacterium]
MTLEESIKTMADAIAAALARNVPSIYLHGSIALNDFKLGWSDIDILVLTNDELTPLQAQKLLGLRQITLERFPDSAYFRLFEGGMRSAAAFIANTSERTVYWGTSGERITNNYCFDSFCMSELLDSGILLHGDDIRIRLTAPTYAQLRDDVARHYQTIRKHGTKGFGWLLDTARCIYTLKAGKVIAKTAAGEWALNEGICPDPNVLSLALQYRRDPIAAKENKDLLDASEQTYSAIQRFADVLNCELESAIHLCR